jgi:UDP-4-amino-4-deoxy-L-arabinose-oxoglutarate aminotransferase
MAKVEFYRHSLTDEDASEVVSVVHSIFLTTGDWTKRFQEKFATMLGAKFAVGVMSCTHALELSLRCFGIGPGDEVVTTPLSFIATGNAIEYVGAKPVFVDVEALTGNMDASRLEAAITPRTKAILPVHLYGQMCDMKALRAIADRHGLKIIEDAAHCLEGSRDGVRPGQLGDVACFSFYATKNLTCGEGGAVTCHDPSINEWMIKGRQHGMSKQAADRYVKRYEHYDMEFLGLKCNMSNLQAALLIHQMDRLPSQLLRREEIARRYDAGFAANPNIGKPAVLEATTHARHLYTIWVKPEKRDEYLGAIQDAGIGIAVNFRAIHLMKYYREKYGFRRGMFPVAERIGDSTITLPLYPKLQDEEIETVIRTVNQIVTS